MPKAPRPGEEAPGRECRSRGKGRFPGGLKAQERSSRSAPDPPGKGHRRPPEPRRPVPGGPGPAPAKQTATHGRVQQRDTPPIGRGPS